MNTLLGGSDCTFNLVANCCAGAEIARMERFCRADPRLELTVLPFNKPVEHGVALNYLYARSDQPYFCFMDSDILAAGDFMAELRPHLAEAAGVFSGWPLTVKASEQIMPDDCIFIGGRHAVSAAGLCLGGTYFAIYQRADLAEAMAWAPAGFKTGYWAQLPPRVRSFLKGIRQERLFYDTGRLLNLFLHPLGRLLRTLPGEALWHLGSYSSFMPGQSIPAAPPPAGFLPGLARRLAGRLRRLGRILNGEAYRRRVLQLVLSDPVQVVVDRRRKRITYYFFDLLQALAEQGPLPELLAVNEPEVDARIAAVTALLASVWQESGLDEAVRPGQSGLQG